MKFRIFPFSKQMLLPVLIFALFGCDQDEIPDYNYFKVNDKEYKIVECVISQGFDNDTSGVLQIGFYFKDLEYWPDDTIHFLSGIPIQKNGVFFNGGIFFGNIGQGEYFIAESIPLGYGYNNNIENYFLGGVTHLGTSVTDLMQSAPIKEGKLSLKIEGKNYVIEFDCTDASYEYKKIKGYFSGVPLEINYKINRGSDEV